MKYEESSVSELFRNTKSFHNREIELSEKIEKLKKTISNELPAMEWPALFSKIMDRTPELLNIKLKDILGNAWTKYRQVAQCLEQGKENPDEAYLVPLLNHTITSEHHPQIDIIIDDISIGKVNFEILLELELKGIILKIKAAQINGVKSGTLQCKGSLSCEGINIFEASSETFDFG